MKTVIFSLLLPFAAVHASVATVNPVSKVIQLLSDLQAKIIAEGEEAHKMYSELTEWCEERSKNLGFEIKTGKSEVAELTASIDEETSIAGSLGTKVEELAASIATDEADLKAATGIREKEAADFKAEETELVDVVDTLQRAIGILEREMSKHGSASMLQEQLQHAGTVVQALNALVQAAAFSSADASRLTALVQQQSSADDSDVGAPAAATYEGHSSGIIDTLGDLLDKAETQLADARNKETSALHNFEMLKQSLEDELKFATKDMAAAKAGIAASNEKKATAEGDLDVTSKDLKEDIEALSDLHQTCLTKAQDYEAATKSRGEELKALAEAKKVVTETTGGAEELTYKGASFFQLGAGSAFLRSGADLAGFEAVRFVRDLARKQHAPRLAQLAARMSSAMRASSGTDDPFSKVKGLIQDMIEKLEAEAGADATEKAYCDKELAESRAKKEEKTIEINKLSTKIDQMTSRSAQLKEEVAALEKALAELALAQAEMDKMRQEEKDVFVKSKADMEQGLQGVKLGLKILRDYYGSEKAHAAAEGAGSSIIGLLEVVESDFSKGLAEMIATEEASQDSYDRESKENEIEKATKEQDVKYKTSEAASLDKTTADAKSDLSGVQEELDAVLEYLKGIEARCIAKPESYAARAERRAAEIDGLKEALKILESETALIQQAAKPGKRRAQLLRASRRL